MTYLASPAKNASALYILGDFFETWVGDDHCADPWVEKIISALRQSTEDGLRINFMHGNRDFLLADVFAANTGARLIGDPFLLSDFGWQFVLSHGDALCTDDQAYMAFRSQVRNPAWQKRFLSLPLAERCALAADLRERSEHVKQDKADYLMDLNAAATDDFLRQHGYATFIHGHTHKPAQHDHIVDGIHVERWVLADWHEDRGEFLAWNGERLARHSC